MPQYEGLLAETVRYAGHNGNEIRGYFARPLGGGPYGSVVVIHHGPAWDEATKEMARKLAHHGYGAVALDLYYREAPDASPEDAAAAVRAQGGVADDRLIGDVEGSMKFLRSQVYSNGKVGVIGFCSGGRQTYVAACNIPSLDAAVDGWGGRVVASPQELTPKQPVAAIDMTPNLACPLLGLFGAEDRNPDPVQVARIEEELKRLGKTHKFVTYEGAGHGFMYPNRPAYRVEATEQAWQEVFSWFGKYLASTAD